ncbi:LysR family transcriptional regulator [Thalassotalea eurytherma]|uniref:LysR family transcriptional regulator n=1 Tax=Thalassotalea eurytherma TaxID=1144278 RepID=A0ABQ6H3X8_9GAMM|nr:LysR family transcriptional regulator [Thalassotalea eurytherma]GLX81460.1 LysR family transcriptional regulator [Thalassotalea eurytherma]
MIRKPVTEYDLKLLKVYLAVVEHGGFSSAASALGLTRSTISIHMSNLETRLGYKLCNRGRAGFSLTEQGREVYSASLKLFDSFDDFGRLIGSLGHQLTGELVILCAEQLDAAKQKKLGQVIQFIHDQFPNLHIVLDGGSIEFIEKQLLSEKAHAGLYPCYLPLDGLEYKKVFSETIYLCCSEQHHFFQLTDTQLTEKMLATASAIHPGIDIDVKGREQLNKLNLSAKSYQFDTRKAMINSGRYLGFLPQSYIQQELNNGSMRIIKPSECFYDFELSLVNKKITREPKKLELINLAFKHAF